MSAQQQSSLMASPAKKEPLTVAEACTFLKNIGLPLRNHQVEGVRTILGWHQRGHGGIVADEMGLGKTCQAIVALAILASSSTSSFVSGDQNTSSSSTARSPRGRSIKGSSRPRILVICPLSVIDHWENEIKRFSCNRLKLWRYYGSKEKREEMRRKWLRRADWDVLLTTFETFLADQQSNLLRIDRWDLAVFDEAHRVKNDQSLLHRAVSSANIDWLLLMTGTPIQNNLPELYALLALVDPNTFPADGAAQFVQKYGTITRDDQVARQFQALFSEHCLRRTKQILKEVPRCSEVILYHGLSPLQYNLYKALLQNNRDFLLQHTQSSKAARQPLHMLLVQLRKCCDHPYLFPGLEPEPFTEGDHLVTNSGKVLLLDRLLGYLKAHGHRVLIFSQMKRFLDIVHDVLTWRGHNFEQLDGSTKTEDRLRAVENFQRPGSDVFAFLLSTKAGGVGLNLTGADTAIFLDWDFNPQNDKQAAARCHRIGQDKPVKIIRLVAKHTVEELIKYRASKKLELSERVLGTDEQEGPSSKADLANLLIEGLKELEEAQAAEGKENKNGKQPKGGQLLSDEQLESRIGGTGRDGRWLLEPDQSNEASSSKNETKPFGGVREDEEEEEAVVKSIYEFEGRDYSADRRALDRILGEKKKADADEQLRQLDAVQRAARKAAAAATATMDFDGLTAAIPSRRAPRPPLTEAEKEARRQARLEADKKRREAAAREREERRHRLWQANDYASSNLPLPAEGPVVENIQQPATIVGNIYDVQGDVTRPERAPTDRCPHALILQTVDDGGHFGEGGMFTALRALNPEIAEHYELTSRMDDLRRGDSHLVEAVAEQAESTPFEALMEPTVAVGGENDDAKNKNMARQLSVVLMVVQSVKDRYTKRISMPALQQCLQRVRHFAVKREEEEIKIKQEGSSQGGPSAATAREVVPGNRSIIKCSVHLPQIWFGLQNADEAQLRHLLSGLLCAHGINVYIYRFRRRHRGGGGGGGPRVPTGLPQAMMAKGGGGKRSPSPAGNSRKRPIAAADGNQKLDGISQQQQHRRKRARIVDDYEEEEDEDGEEEEREKMTDDDEEELAEEEDWEEESEEEEEDDYVPSESEEE